MLLSNWTEEGKEDQGRQSSLDGGMDEDCTAVFRRDELCIEGDSYLLDALK